jgi:hypothetical protein
VLCTLLGGSRDQLLRGESWPLIDLEYKSTYVGHVTSSIKVTYVGHVTSSIRVTYMGHVTSSIRVAYMGHVTSSIKYIQYVGHVVRHSEANLGPIEGLGFRV